MTPPTELRLSKDRRLLSVTFADLHHDLSAEFLRVESPSAEVKGHGPEEKRTIPNKKDVRINHIEPVGHYAVKLHFSDGHKTGLFTWEYLYSLAKNHDRIWTDYLKNIKQQGLFR
jgi:DUF971 family protein